ncbi:hypothetical protein BCR41DRAFT_349269 [Lobosporangium transversale]|uniref:Uncharacterized protein n=1 Tax=Lobosporangium transversale TaxID=64571 RepID=A0A1Y2GUD4_9FUNG|nr:hypothetical protein BCR41DRAFT_349269 [Lobosporangium transversale]ORZ23836.1 hypothetical protein BCR41DRAFT_349269 [Lobosporangium transversale]|eukprot:XP_021883650.1 hypothetical protein BCR41DRAFT_349269 [Lobosporangium transversale]
MTNEESQAITRLLLRPTETCQFISLLVSFSTHSTVLFVQLSFVDMHFILLLLLLLFLLLLLLQLLFAILHPFMYSRQYTVISLTLHMQIPYLFYRPSIFYL